MHWCDVGAVVYVGGAGVLVCERWSSIPTKILRPLHAPAAPPTQNNEKVVDSEENSKDAQNSETVVDSEKNSKDLPRDHTRKTAVDNEKNSQNAPCGSAATCEKQREGRRFQKNLQDAGHPPKTARGFAIRVKNSCGATTRASQHAPNPQKVRRRALECARHHSESDSTRTEPAEGSPATLKIRTAPQQERFDTHETHKGLANDFAN